MLKAINELRAAGQDRLAEIMARLPSAVCDGDHAVAEAMIPEGLALARAINSPWIEVYLRHWIAQSRVSHRRDVTQGMSEVISLLEFAHTEAAAECPQSICVTQDVCLAYAVLDGPGYARERLAVAAETMERINVRWPCFECIGSEYARALMALDRFAEAEQYCHDRMIEQAAIGTVGYDALGLYRVKAMIWQGRFADALDFLKTPLKDSANKSKHDRYTLLKCLAHAGLGQLEPALACWRSHDRLSPSEYAMWARCAFALCTLDPQRNHSALDEDFRQIIGELERSGALYEQAEIGMTAAQLAAARSDPDALARHLAQVESVLPKLRRPEPIAVQWRQLKDESVRAD
ncbi:hypothetical protein [Tahibacter amnicola]|uniref:Tetratricopeptide repeat protein n=1 Tax=Tahibacter amnicola TaxID=2976241 RepID=A0ABY6B7S6_9GAMM|nr:hypothetical protein [Tahibacter amnicola]UXI65822.1 hypothetical protein N4264_13725 [Tahibacter amnicola]